MNKSILYGLLLLAPAAAAGPFAGVECVAFDVETTGFSADSGRIIEIGAARLRDGRIVESAHWLVNPGIPIGNSAVHGITDARVAGQPGFDEAYRAFREFAGDAVLFAHNAPFDIRFMAAEVERNGLEPCPNPVVDTLALFRRWHPEAPSHRLGELADRFGIPVAAAHRAEDDARTLLLILLHGLGERPGLAMEQLRVEANGFHLFDGSRR